MPLQLLKLLVVLFLGYLYIELLPDLSIVSDFVFELVLSPVKFIVAAIVFFIGVIFQGDLIRQEFEACKSLKDRTFSNHLFLIPLNVIILYSLFCFSEAQTIVFFLTAFVYGMISIVFRG